MLPDNNLLFILNNEEFIFKFKKCRHIYNLYILISFKYIIYVSLIETIYTRFSSYFQIDPSNHYPECLQYQNSNIIYFKFYVYRTDKTLKL